MKQLRLRNWAELPVEPASIDAVLLTHAHIDHSGYLPALVRDGFAGPVFCSEPTRALCEILLPDAAYLQEEDAGYANRKGFSKHHPALPLFTEADADAAIARLVPVAFDALAGGRSDSASGSSRPDTSSAPPRSRSSTPGARCSSRATSAAATTS